MPGEEHRQIVHEVSAVTVAKVLLVLLAFTLLYLVRDILLVFFVALVLAALITPLAEQLERRKIPRSLTVLGVYILIIAIFLIILAALVPPLLEEFRGILTNFALVWRKVLQSLGAFYVFPQADGWEDNLRQSFGAVSGQLPRVALGAFSGLSGFVGGFFSLVLAFVLSFYMVVEAEGLKRFIKMLAPRRHESYLVGILTRVQKKLGDWLRAQLILSGTLAFILYIGLLALGMPYALVLAILAGLLEFVPYAGPVLAATPSLLLGLSITPLKAVLVLLLYVLVQWVQNHFFIPKIAQRFIGVNPVVSILALLVGARLAGMLGVVIAIPIAASLTMLVEDYIEHRDRSGNDREDA